MARTSTTFATLAAIVFAAAASTPSRAQATDEQPTVRTAMGPVRVLHAPDGVRDARVVVCTHYRTLEGRLQDHRQYLADLQARFGERGLGVFVLMPPEAAQELAADEPRFLVAAREADDQTAALQGVPFLLCDGVGGALLGTATHVDVLVDAIEGALAGTLDAQELQQASTALLSLLANVADGGQFDPQVQHCLSKLPHSGRAHACAVLNEWWCKGDLEAADRAIDRALTALANEPPSLVHFVDLVLRGDRNDEALQKKLFMAITPAAAASDGVFTQLVYLRALLRAGQDRLAGRVAAKLPKRLQHAEQQLVFAETLMEGKTPMAFRDRAEQSVRQAEQQGGEKQWIYAARHKILKRCGDDEAAEKLMVTYRRDGFGNGSLNNDAWYLMIRPATLGRFDTLALAQCEEMMRQEGAALDPNSKDTAALAFYVNGHVARAAELQGEVKTAGVTGSTYAARLKRYEAVLARQQQAKDKKD